MNDPEGAPRPPATDPAGSGTRFLRESLVLYGAIYVGVAFHFVGGFLVAKFLGPATYGLRAIFGLVEQYESVATLGTYSAMEREVPYHWGRGDPEEADRISQNVLTANLLYGVCLAVILVGASFPLRGSPVDPIYADFLLFIAAYVLINRFERFFRIDLIIRKRTGSVSGLKVVDGTVTAVVTVILTYFFDLRGLFVGILIGKGIATIYAAIRSGRPPGFGMSWPLLRRLVAIGFPIKLVSFLFILFQTVDKVLIAAFLPTAMLGYFAVAAILSGVVFGTLADAAKVMFAPRMMEKLGRTGDPLAVKSYLTEPTMLIAWLIPLAVGSLFLVVHLPFEHVLTEYLPAIPVAKILLLGQHFFAVVTMSLLTCIALGRQVAVVWLTFGGIVVNAVLNLTFLQMGWGINGVAVGTGLSYFLYTVVVSLFTLRLFGQTGPGEGIRMVAGIVVPWAVAVTILLTVDWALPVEGLTLWGDLGVSTLRVFLFVVLFGLSIIPVRGHPGFVRLRESLSGFRRKAGKGGVAG